MPELAADLLRSEVVTAQPDAVLAICERVQALQNARAELQRQVSPSALTMDWQEARLAIGAKGRSFFRFMSGRYRNAMANLKGVARDNVPRTYKERLALLDRLIHYHTELDAIVRRRDLGQQALGGQWADEETDLTAVLPAMRWIAAQIVFAGSGAALGRQLDGWPRGSDPAVMAADLLSLLDQFSMMWGGAAGQIGLDYKAAFDCDAIVDVPLRAIAARLHDWLTNMEGLVEWNRLYDAARTVSELGLDPIRMRLATGMLAPEQAIGTLIYVRAEAVWTRLTRLMPDLASMDGRDRSQLVEEFRQLDQRLLLLAVQEVVCSHYKSVPDGTRGVMGTRARGGEQKDPSHALAKASGPGC